MATIPTGQKFHTVPSSVVTQERGSALANSQREIYTMQDIIDTVRPYKVFTALLTQSGGDNVQSLLSQDTPSLTIGVTYQIVDDGGFGWDFTNVGAPNNDLNTYFIATGTTPASWGTNAMLQYNTGTPEAIVLENTIGYIWFTYDDTGQYGINLDDTFIEEKTFILTPSSGYDSNVLQGGGGDPYSIYRFSDNKCSILTSNGSLNKSPIEIRVYP